MKKALGFPTVASASSSRVDVIHIVHQTHTDLGYTDLPSTIWELHVDYLRRALECERRTRRHPPGARFRWVCESMLVVERFLATATALEKRQFDELVSSGAWEVAAMPFNATGLMDAAEWSALHARLRPLHHAYRPVTVFQNDVNGLPWGGIPAWRRAGFRYVWMGVNLHAGGHPEPAPCFWQWEGPTGARMLTYLALHYNYAYFFLHRSEWRRGPVPSATDVWFNEPQPGDIYGTSPAELKAAHALLQENLRTQLPAAYPLRILALQATNQYRFDNDPPLPLLCDFVRAWNAAGLQPALKLSTCREFMGEAARALGRSAPVRRGDWQDWWDNGVASTPTETALNQHAKRLLVDAPRAAKILRSSAAVAERQKQAWLLASLYDEHTWGSYDSVAYPYRTSTQGGIMQKLGLAYQSREEAALAQAELLRAAPAYRPFTTTRHLTVLNPGRTARSGWVEISAQALRAPANAVRDTSNNEILALDDVIEAAWSKPVERPDLPFEVPNDIWAFTVCRQRFHVSGLAAGRLRRFELIEAELPAPTPPAERGRAGQLRWTWDTVLGRPASLRHGRRELLDASAPFGFGQLVIERGTGFGARSRIEKHDAVAAPGAVERRTPTLRAVRSVPHRSIDRYESDWDDPAFHRVQQRWDIHRATGEVELTTTLWIKEDTAAQSFFLAFPFALPDAAPRYYSWGYPTRVGKDQLPGACGEYAVVHEGVEVVSPAVTLALATPDTPLVSFGRLHGHGGQRTFTPDTAHIYAMLHNNYWNTNFTITRAAKLIVRHRLSTTQSLAALNSDLWAFPSR